MNDKEPPKLRFIDLRTTEEGYEPIIERYDDGSVKSVIYCPHMPVNLEEVQEWHRQNKKASSNFSMKKEMKWTAEAEKMLALLGKNDEDISSEEKSDRNDFYLDVTYQILKTIELQNKHE
jgi:hypothetical protein